MKILKYKLLNNIPIIFVFTIIIGLAEITLILSKNRNVLFQLIVVFYFSVSCNIHLLTFN